MFMEFKYFFSAGGAANSWRYGLKSWYAAPFQAIPNDQYADVQYAANRL